jgi:predicted O-methyltransferase YrrM
MFHEIPSSILERMIELIELDAKDRANDTPLLQRLRQIPPESGKFLSLLAASAPEGEFVEIGTSGGYSTLWLTLACQKSGKKVITFEMLPEKIKIAKETFKKANVERYVKLIEKDAREGLTQIENISFCFLDAEKEYYEECYNQVIPNMVKGGILVADNVISHKNDLQPLVEKILADSRVDTLIVPIGSGLLFCRKI